MLLGWGDLTFLRIFSFDSSKELLPLTAKSLGLKTDIIVDSILRESNFRIWDMNIKVLRNWRFDISSKWPVLPYMIECRRKTASREK